MSACGLLIQVPTKAIQTDLEDRQIIQYGDVRDVNINTKFYCYIGEKCYINKGLYFMQRNVV